MKKEEKEGHLPEYEANKWEQMYRLSMILFPLQIRGV